RDVERRTAGVRAEAEFVTGGSTAAGRRTGPGRGDAPGGSEVDQGLARDHDHAPASGVISNLRPTPARNCASASAYRLNGNRWLMIGSGGSTPAMKGSAARSKLWRIAIEPVTVISWW